MAEPIRTKEEDAAAERVGSTIRGKWRLDSMLGVGGVAAVYGATHRNGQRAALKIMHPELARDRSIVERFLREAYVANKVNHPACVRVLDDDTTEGDEPFLVMELLEGETVRDYWRRTGRTIPVSQALHISERVLDCLSACHAAGVVHRDLKPANIFLLRDGRIKLLDFGVAREEGARHEGDKTVGLALGTPAYMSPEQANGRVDRIDGRSDLFSVGALLHALITGRRIHRGKTEKESLHLAANEPVPSVATIDPTLAGELVRLIDKALSWEPERRFPSAREMQSVVISAMRVASDQARAQPEGGDAEEQETDLTPVHEVVAREDPRVREVEAMLAAWEQAIVAGLLQGFESPSTEPAIRRAFDACGEVLRKRGTAIALVVRPFGLAAFDHVVWQPARPLAAVPHRMFESGVRGVRVTPGVSFAEMRMLLAAMAAPSDADVGALLWEAPMPHVRIDACVVSGLGDIAARESFASESLRDESESAHRVHAARDAGAAWGDEPSPLAPDEVIRAVYASQLAVDRWDERYAELYAEGLIQGARTRNVAPMLGALRKVATELYTQRKYDDAASLRHAVTERLTQRVGPKDAPKLAGAVTSAMLGKEALDALLRTLAQNPSDLSRAASQLDEVPAAEAPTILAAAARPMPIEVQRAVSDLAARAAGPERAASMIGDRPSSVPTQRNEISEDMLIPRDPATDRRARIVACLAALLDNAPGHADAVTTLARDLAEETASGRFEIFFGESVTFIAGRMLYADRATHEAAAQISALLARCGAHALSCASPPTVEQLRGFASAIAAALDRAARLPTVGPLVLEALSQAARTRGVAMERLAIEPRVMRVHASAVAALRIAKDTLASGRAIAHVARSIVDVAGAPAWLLAAVTEPNSQADDAARAVSAAMLATAMARLLVEDRAQLVRISLAALTAPQASADDALLRAAVALASQTSGQRTALARAVIAFETTWMARTDRDGPLYRGARAPTLHARVVTAARGYVDALADKTPPPPTPESIVANHAQRTQDTAERTVLRLLVATLGFIPAGTVVRLVSGETAEVIASNRATGRGPLARLVLDESGEEYSEPFEVELILVGDDPLRVQKIVSIEQWRKGEEKVAPKSTAPRRTPVPMIAPSQESSPVVLDEIEPGDQVSGARPASAAASPPPVAVPAPAPVISTAPQAAGPTAAGTLATTPVVNTLVYMLDHGLSGTIELREPDGVKHEIYFVRGGPVRVRTGRPIAPLGSLLVNAGFLRDVDIAEAVTSARGMGMKLGEWLVQRELVARVDLLRTLEIQVVRKIEGLVNLDPKTTFAFYRDEDLFGDGTPDRLEVDPLGTIFASARGWKDRDRVRKVVERASQLLLAIHPDSTLELVELTDDERSLLAELRSSPSHFVELVTRSTAMPETIDTFLFVALVTRQLLVPGQAKPPMGVRPSSLRAGANPSPFPHSSPPQSLRMPREDAVISRSPPPVSTRSPAPVSSPVLPRSASPSPSASPASVRSPGQKKISWSDLLAVRRPPSQASMRAPSRTPQPVPAVSKPAPQKVKPAPLTGSAAEAAALVRRAEQALQHKDIAGAVKLSLRARTMDGNVPHVNAFAAWVSVLGGESRATDAIVELDKIIGQHEDCIPARLYRAKLLKRDDRMPEAMRELEVVLQLDPDNRDAQNELKLLMLTIKPTR